MKGFMIDYFERKLRFKDMEIWDIRFGKDIYRMLIVDENRASEIKDLNLPLMQGYLKKI